jgi:hypothetical protein
MKPGMELIDVGGSFKKFLRTAAPTIRKNAEQAIDKTGQSLVQRMRSMAPVGPDAPHIRDAITYRRRGTLVEVGLLDAGQPAGPGSNATMADVALYNEYNPNQQPFMRPAAEQEDRAFVNRVTDAVKQAERNLSIG